MTRRDASTSVEPGELLPESPKAAVEAPEPRPWLQEGGGDLWKVTERASGKARMRTLNSWFQT